VRLVADKKVAESRDVVLIRRLGVALAEYHGVPVSQRHYARARRLLNSRQGPLPGQAEKKAKIEIESMIG
jgi:hypothetical protein